MTIRRKPAYPKREWSKTDKDFLQRHYETMPMLEIIDTLKRSDQAIHAMASRLGITGKRYGVNNYLAGKSYKAAGRKVTPQQKMKRQQPKQVTIVIRGRKKKTKKRRWCDQKLAVKPFTAEGKKVVRVDQKTVIYVPADATIQEIERLVNRYKK